MKLELNIIYNYIFGTGAVIDTSKVPEDKRSEKIQKITQEIQAKFNSIPKEKREQFRSFLRQNGSTHLEQVLFGVDNQEPDTSYRLNNSETTKKLFAQINDEYHYFKLTPQLENLFIEIFNTRMLVGDFFEDNNNIFNKTKIYAMDAYMILVLFGTEKLPVVLKNLESYLNNYNFSTSATPLHDALLYSIPKNEPALNLGKWQQIIKQNGPKACMLFQRAVEIEQFLGRAPVSFEEANDAVTKLTYKAATEYPELAELCNLYDIEESVFNRCLEVDKQRKVADKLPNIIIDSSKVSQHPGYYLVKLPIDDPRAYVLGYITNCCQSIGGESEECVVNGITSEDNGFYVLLKCRKNNYPNNPFTHDGKVDYQNFEIVGQGYAWLSQRNNLCIDSWENLRPEVDDQLTVELLKEFGKQAAKSSPSISRVTLGLGGKTPKVFQENKLDNPEELKVGKQYGDSLDQALLFSDEQKIHEKILSIKKPVQAWGKKFSPNVDIFSVLASKTDFSSLEDINSIVELMSPAKYSFWTKFLAKKEKSFFPGKFFFNKTKNANNDGSPATDNLNQFLNFDSNLWGIVRELDRAQLLEPVRLHKILSRTKNNSQLIQKLHQALIDLRDAGCLTDKNFTQIFEHPTLVSIYQLDDISTAIASLGAKKLIDQEFLDQSFIPALEYSKQFAYTVCDIHDTLDDSIPTWQMHRLFKAYLTLDKAGILTLEIRQALAARISKDIPQYTKGLLDLKELGLLNTLNRKLLFRYIESKGIDIVILLNNFNKDGLLTETNQKILLDSYDRNIVDVMELLRQMDSLNLLTLENQTFILANREIVPDLIELYKLDCLSPKIFEILAASPAESLMSVSNALIVLVACGVANQENLEIISQNIPTLVSAKEAILIVARLRVLTPEIFKLISSNPEIINNIHKLMLYDNFMPLDSLIKKKLLTADVYKTIILHPSDAENIETALITLKNLKINNPQLRQTILDKPKYAKALVETINNCVLSNTNKSDDPQIMQVANIVIELEKFIRKQAKHPELFHSETRISEQVWAAKALLSAFKGKTPVGFFDWRVKMSFDDSEMEDVAKEALDYCAKLGNHK